MDIEEYEEIKRLLYTNNLTQYGKRKLIDYIENQQKELNKQEKIINAMAEDISVDGQFKYYICRNTEKCDKDNDCCLYCIKKYYEKKVSEG